MERRPSFKSADRSAKLLQAIQQEDLETFRATLSEAQPDEVLRPYHITLAVILCDSRFYRRERTTSNVD